MEMLYEQISKELNEAEKHFSASYKLLKLYQMVIESSHDLFCLVDMEWRYQLFNKEYAHYHDIGDDDIIGKKASEVLGEERFNVLLPHIERCAKGEQVMFEMDRDFPKMGRRRVLVNYFPITDPHSENVQGVSAIIKDITELRNIVHV